MCESKPIKAIMLSYLILAAIQSLHEMTKVFRHIDQRRFYAPESETLQPNLEKLHPAHVHFLYLPAVDADAMLTAWFELL